MIVVSTDTVAGRRHEVLGLAKGATVQTVHMGKDIAASFRTMVGGEAKGYNEMMEKARNIALDRMEEDARRMGADAIVAIRFASSSIMQSAAEIMVYGTAVKLLD